jgi:propanediol utilization protein
VTEQELIRLITEQVVRRLGCHYGPQTGARNGIPIGVSVRHCHLSPQNAETLFGAGHELHVRNWLYQPDQFAAHETVTVVGPRGALHNVRVLGPTRSAPQVEVSRTDAIALGVMPPIRQSVADGDGERIVLVGPAGIVDAPNAFIRAKRHIHIHPDGAAEVGVKDGDLVDVRLEGGNQLTLNEVLIRVNPDFLPEMHLDTDEGNAADLICGDKAFVV